MFYESKLNICIYLLNVYYQYVVEEKYILDSFVKYF